MRKNVFLFALAVLTFTCFVALNACNNPRKTRHELPKVGDITQNLRNLGRAYLNLSKTASVIDSDEESLWSYEQADSILRILDFKDPDKAEAMIYSAESYIFYGMSYTRTNDLEELQKLVDVIIKIGEIDKYSVLQYELRSIYAPIFFYKMSRMPSTMELIKLYDVESEKLKSLDKKDAGDLIVQKMRLKHLWFNVYSQMLADIKQDDQAAAKYAEAFYNLPLSIESLDKMSSESYTKVLKDCLDAQADMVNDLATTINNLP